MKERNSNLELLRIIAMLIIIAHHYVVNSGLTQMYDYNHITGNMIFLQFLGFGGKMAINIFVLISCYFMCTYKLTWLKVLKLYLEIKFYSVIIFIIFVIAGYRELNLINVIKVIFNLAYSINVSFTGSFMAFYMLIPFLNRGLKNLSKKMHMGLCGILIFIFTIISTFSFGNDTWNYIGWYVTLYFIASYIRLYPCKYTMQKKYSIYLLTTSLLLIFASILVVDFIGYKIGFMDIYYMFSDSHKLLALTCSISLFILFNNIKIRNNKIINKIAATTFGVFLIHTRGDAMRTFLWSDLLNNCKYYSSMLLPIHAVMSVFMVFIVCSVIDTLRIKFIEKPLFYRLGKISILKKECFAEYNE